MAWQYTPDPPPFQPWGGQQQPIYIPPAPPAKTGKKANKASLKQMFKARQELDSFIEALEKAAKEKKKDDKPKKKDGLNWVELTLCLVMCSIPIASVELIAIYAIAKVIPH